MYCLMMSAAEVDGFSPEAAGAGAAPATGAVATGAGAGAGAFTPVSSGGGSFTAGNADLSATGSATAVAASVGAYPGIPGA